MNAKEELVGALHANDEFMETHPPGEGSPMPALFRALNIEPEDAFKMAEQRAIRQLAYTTGVHPSALTREDLKRNEAFMAHAGNMFLDGLGCGAKVTTLTAEQLAAAMLLPLFELLSASGGNEDTKLGEFSDAGDAARLELAKAIIDRIHGIMPPSEEGEADGAG